MKKVLYLLLACIMPLTFAMEDGTQRKHPNEVDCWQRHGLNIPGIQISCRSAARETDAYPVIEYHDGTQKKELTGMSHQTYRILFDAINNAKPALPEMAQLHQELRNIVNRLPYSEVIFNGLSQEIKDKLAAGNLQVVVPGIIEQEYPQFFADKDHKKFALVVLNQANFLEKINAALTEIPAFEQKVNALPKKENDAQKVASEWLQPGILISAGVIAMAIVGVLLWKLFKKPLSNEQKKDKKKQENKKVRFDENKNTVHVLNSQ